MKFIFTFPPLYITLIVTKGAAKSYTLRGKLLLGAWFPNFALQKIVICPGSEKLVSKESLGNCQSVNGTTERHYQKVEFTSCPFPTISSRKGLAEI
jgi:hypothetical protein